MSEQNKVVVSRYMEEVFNRKNAALLDQLVVSNCVIHTPEGDVHGLDGLKQIVAGYRVIFPDHHFTVDDLVAEGDKVAIRWTMRGTHSGELRDIRPTGKKVTLTGMSIFRVAGGKIAEDWVSPDTLGLLQQLGAVLKTG